MTVIERAPSASEVETTQPAVPVAADNSFNDHQDCRTVSFTLPSGRVVAGYGVVGAAVLLLAMLIVELLLGPVLQARSQHDLLLRLRGDFRAAAQRQAIAADTAKTLAACQASVSGCPASVAAGARPSASDLDVVAPLPGKPVAVLQIPALHLNQAVVEGDLASQTQDGPGHVPGTPLPGQAGNVGIVGRRSTWGAVFRSLPSLRGGSEITVTTFQGVSRYRVTKVSSASSTNDPFSYAGSNELTLMTGTPPLLASGAVLVTASLEGVPYAPTPQGVRQPGREGRASSLAPLPLALLLLQLLVLALVATWLARRHLGGRLSYSLATPVLLALLILLSEAADRMLPGVI